MKKVARDEYIVFRLRNWECAYLPVHLSKPCVLFLTKIKLFDLIDNIYSTGLSVIILPVSAPAQLESPSLVSCKRGGGGVVGSRPMTHVYNILIKNYQS